MRYETYFNLHRKCLSYRAMRGGRVQHADVLEFTDPSFVVQPAGRERVLREGRKNVHAFVRGELVGMWDEESPAPEGYQPIGIGWRRVTYNPYKYKSFVWADTEEPVRRAQRAVLCGRQIYALPMQDA
jgi:hypothetical protein